ncbi:asparagine synthase-related protein [Streptomyces sp. NPDC020096]
MRWLVGWSSAVARSSVVAGRTLLPVGGQLLWGDPDPLWAVGDWRPDEIRVITADPTRPGGNGAYGAYGFNSVQRNGGGPVPARLAVLGRCLASDDELRIGLYAARGGALRHLTMWAGSYTAVLQIGRRTTIVADLAGARPVFHTPWSGGTAYATAALPLADLVEAGLDVTYLAAQLACPDSPEALGNGTPYQNVRRVLPGHALILREGVPEVSGYEPHASLAIGASRSVMDAEQAVAGVRDALVEAVRARMAQPRFVPDPGDAPAPGIGADLSGGSASATLALLAAGLPGMPGTPIGLGAQAGQRLLAVTFNDLATSGEQGRDAELERARRMAADPRLHHVVVPGGPESLPFADLLDSGPLTDEPGPALITAERHRRRLAAGGADHFIGQGARHVLDAHPARLADLLLDRHRRHLLRPAAALARAERSSARSAFVPLTLYRAARRLARTPYQQGVEDAAGRLLERRFDDFGAGGLTASLAALTWCRPGPAARWLTGEALAEVSVRLSDAAARPGSVGRPGERRARAALTRAAADLRVFEQAVEVRSQRLHAPFLDNQVVRAAQALPEAMRVRPGARASVLRAVLAGAGVRDLPPGWGATTNASGAVQVGLRAAVDDLMDLFSAPLLADAGLVDARVVRGALRAAADGEALPLDGLGELISTEVWLRRLLARRGSCWTGPDAPGALALAFRAISLPPSL